MFASRKVLSTAVRRFGAVAAEAPRDTIAKNAVKFAAIRNAGNEAALDAAIKAQINVDAANLPAEISTLSRYLTSGSAGGLEKFTKNAAAWQNLSFDAAFGRESGRQDAWPFLAGGV